MPLGPTVAEFVARARADLRMGVPVVLTSSDAHAIFAAAEGIAQDRLDQIRQIGMPVLAITARRAETLKAVAYDGDLARLLLPASADIRWIASVSDPADDLSMPLKGPFKCERGGAADIHRAAIQIAKSARLLPAAVVAPVADGPALAAAQGLTCLSLDEIAPWLGQISPLTDVVSGRVPLAVSETGRVHVFRPDDGGEEHYATEIGRPARDKPVLTRLHSACFTGDVLGSLKCDCGAQLQTALRQLGQAGAGVLLYLNQEGRGIGLANKMRAYALQDQGFDTVEANHRLGFEDDERDFRIGAAILHSMGIGSVRLLTNNPEKVRMMEANGIDVVERVPLKVGRGPLNSKYLDIKAKKSGHIL